MKDKPLVSILMPVYNAEQFLVETLRSIQSQTLKNWELIVVNDFSDDRSADLVEQFAKGDERIRLYPNTRKGIVPALDLAFRKSSGTFITRMDADDLMPEYKLELLSKAAKKDEKVVVTGKVTYFSDHILSEGYQRYEKWLNERVEIGDYWENIYRECVIASPNWLVSRNCFEEDIDLSKLLYPEDYDMTFLWYAKGYRVQTVDQVTHLWREHAKRTSRNVEAYQQQSFFNLKTKRFIALELKEGERIQLIGSGRKGKMVAQILLAKRIDFAWFDFNENKHGQLILGKQIAELSLMDPDSKTILTSWPLSEKSKREIVAFFQALEMRFGKDYWLF